MGHKMKLDHSIFFTPEEITQEQKEKLDPARGKLIIASCRSGAFLAEKVVEEYQRLLLQGESKDRVLYEGNIDKNFSDSETCVNLENHVSGYDVFLFQALLDPTSDRSVDQNYIALYIAARAFKEHGANHVTAIVPYLAYARQDRPTTFMREPTTAKLMADLSIQAGIDRIVIWDVHSGQTRGFYGTIPVNMLDSLTLYINEFKHFQGRNDVIAVAPDEGAAKHITHFGQAMNLKCAIASKHRPKPEIAIIEEIIGDFKGKQIAIILDDMISSGNTIFEVVKKLVDEKGINEIYLGISHNLCIEKARAKLEEMHSKYHLKKVLITNSIPQTESFRAIDFIEEICLSEILARTINRIHYNKSVSEVFYRPK